MLRAKCATAQFENSSANARKTFGLYNQQPRLLSIFIINKGGGTVLYIYCGEIYVNLTYKNIKQIYEISTLGNIRNKNTGDIRKPHPNEKGYLQCKLMLDDNSMKTFKITIFHH